MNLDKINQSIALGQYSLDTYQEYQALVALAEPITKAIAKFKSRMDKVKTQTEIGDSFMFGDTKFIVTMHSEKINYSQAYDIALSLVPKTKRAAVLETVAAECVKKSKSAKAAS